MQIKDYYSILELAPSATLAEIKRAFHKLAQDFHPDKNNNDPYKASRFSEIKEAYEVLTNPSKKEYYLQQRWYHQSMGKKFSNESITPVTLLKKCLELNKYVASLDINRMDKKGLTEYIKNILSDGTIEQLKTFNEPDINKTIIDSIIKTSKFLSFQQAKEIAEQLFKLAGNDTECKNQITDTLYKHAKKEKREKIQPLILILITIIICLLIYMMNQ